jgi:hypothetical protein
MLGDVYDKTGDCSIFRRARHGIVSKPSNGNTEAKGRGAMAAPNFNRITSVPVGQEVFLTAGRTCHFI